MNDIGLKETLFYSRIFPEMKNDVWNLSDMLCDILRVALSILDTGDVVVSAPREIVIKGNDTVPVCM
jgi:hypothetical protein